jgi:general nucleoside transport system permease protein
MMIMGAICGFVTAVETGSPMLGFLGGALGGARSPVFAVLTQYLLANQVATGLALTLFGLGLSSADRAGLCGHQAAGPTAAAFRPLADIPFLGPCCSAMTGWSISLAGGRGGLGVLKYSRAGLILRAVGESHDAAHALGYKVVRIRLMALPLAAPWRGWAAPTQPCARAAMDRRDHRGRGLDRAGDRGLCQLGPGAFCWVPIFSADHRLAA